MFSSLFVFFLSFFSEEIGPSALGSHETMQTAFDAHFGMICLSEDA
jgi:hypothetical protein